MMRTYTVRMGSTALTVLSKGGSVIGALFILSFYLVNNASEVGAKLQKTINQ